MNNSFYKSRVVVVKLLIEVIDGYIGRRLELSSSPQGYRSGFIAKENIQVPTIRSSVLMTLFSHDSL